MQDDRLALLNPLQGGLTLAAVTAGSGFWDPLWPPISTAQALAYLHITGKQLTSPSGSSCCWKCSSGTCCRDPGSCYTAKLEGTTAAPNTESRAVTSAKAGKATNSCCWLKYRVRLLLPRQIVGGSCCTEAGSKWYLAARQTLSHLWHHSPPRQGKMQQSKVSKDHIQPDSQ